MTLNAFFWNLVSDRMEGVSQEQIEESMTKSEDWFNKQRYLVWFSKQWWSFPLTILVFPLAKAGLNYLYDWAESFGAEDAPNEMDEKKMALQVLAKYLGVVSSPGSKSDY